MICLPYLQINRLNIVKMSIPSKVIYRFNTIPFKIPTVVLKKFKSYSQIYMEKLRLSEAKQKQKL